MPFLSFELAQELKEAGFPQLSNGPTLYYLNEQTMIVAYPEAAVLSDRSVRVPTLNEMISACGADITYIVRTGRGWSANGDNGETVTEAVARRWMSLHRNDRSRCSPTDITDSSLLWSEELADCSTQTHP